MLKKVLVIVPHPDDEINIAGGILPILSSYGIETTIVICTNGDYIAEYAKKRYDETKKAKEFLRYDKLIYLGYGDGYLNEHIYNSENIVVSHCGKSETYSVSNSDEYCFQQYGIHRKYLRSNFKEDLYDVIVNIKADLVICNDIDNHPDHQCVSLLFDECICKIARETSYKPLILKGFAYNGVWKGPKDFFSETIEPTKCRYRGLDDDFSLCYPYLWEDRLQIKNHVNVTSLKLWKNPIFRSLYAYKTQSKYNDIADCAIANFERVANADSVYFFRNIQNLCLKSRIVVSSGCGDYLNDGILCSLDTVRFDDNLFGNRYWQPSLKDLEPFINIYFPMESAISQIVIYQEIPSLSAVQIYCHGIAVKFYECKGDRIIKINIKPLKTESLMLRFIFSDYTQVKICEIECYDHKALQPFDMLPLCEYNKTERRNFYGLTRMIKILYSLYVFVIRFRNKIYHKIGKGICPILRFL